MIFDTSIYSVVCILDRQATNTDNQWAGRQCEEEEGCDVVAVNFNTWLEIDTGADNGSC
jgi:hypothetical protein